MSEDEIDSITRAAAPHTAGYVGAIVLALFFPKAAAIGYLVTATIAIVRARGDDPPEEATQGACSARNAS